MIALRIVIGALAATMCLSVATSEAHEYLVPSLVGMFALGVAGLVGLAVTRKKK